MTSQIIVLNKNRSFAITESNLILNETKTYSGEEKIFKLSDKHSAVILLSGNGRFDSKKLKDLISKYISQTDMGKIKTIDEIKTSLNECIRKSSKKIDITEYIKTTFPKFERIIKNLSKNMNQEELIQHLKINSINENIDILDQNKTLNNKINRLINSIFTISNENELKSIKIYIKNSYYDYLIRISPNIVIVGYDDENENPTFVKYAILFNNEKELEIKEEYSVHNCKSTMIFTIAQEEDIILSLTGLNDKTFNNIKQILHELIKQHLESSNVDLLNELNEQIETKLYEMQIKNLSEIIEYIEFLPDLEILKLLDILIELTSVKKKFSNEPHSVGGKRIKAILRKYDKVKFVNENI